METNESKLLEHKQPKIYEILPDVFGRKYLHESYWANDASGPEIYAEPKYARMSEVVLESLGVYEQIINKEEKLFMVDTIWIENERTKEIERFPIRPCPSIYHENQIRELDPVKADVLELI